MNNVVIVSDGNYVDPSIDRIYRINLDNETAIERERKVIFEYEKKFGRKAFDYARSIFKEGTVTRYLAADFPAYKEIQGSGRSSGSRSGENNRYYQFEQDRGGDTGEAERTGINTDIRTSQMADVDDAEPEAQTLTESAPNEPVPRYPMRYDIPEDANIKITAKGRDSLEQADIDAFNRRHS